MRQRKSRIHAQEKARLAEAVERLVKLYEATDKKEEAAKRAKGIHGGARGILDGALHAGRDPNACRAADLTRSDNSTAIARQSLAVVWSESPMRTYRVGF
jgi:hypothetical protein